MRRRPCLRLLLALAPLPLLPACAGRGAEGWEEREPRWPDAPRRPESEVGSEWLAVDGPLNLNLEQGPPGEPRYERAGSEPLQLRAEREGLLIYQPGDRGARARLSRPALRELQVRGESQVQLGPWRAESLSLVLSGGGSLNAPRLEARQLRLRLLGSGRMVLGGLRCERLEVLISGSGSLKLEGLQTELLDARLRASGNFSASGRAQRQHWHLSGSGDVDAEDLSGRAAQLRSFGSGDAALGPLETLEVELFGSGDLVYGGRPQLSQRSLGSGRVKPR